jgi:3'-phosphoadenosine 5'-phosphosulfate sulfotransferase (PAPS reductase)/FAD synthetase
LTEPDQLGLWPGADADEVIRNAREEHSPIASYCLFSGGNDSKVLAHRCREHYETLAFVDTGTALPGVREFVESFAEFLDKPLEVFEAPEGAYRGIVIGRKTQTGYFEGMGFPGPMQHGICFNQLKENGIDDLIRQAKKGHPRTSTVMLLTGTRRAESARRFRTTRAPYRRDGGKLWVSPLIDWSNARMADYRAEYELPESDVAALIHRSGECNCGAFASPGEREELKSLWPAWFAETIEPLEREARELGKQACEWGSGRVTMEAARADPGELCSDCQLRILE